MSELALYEEVNRIVPKDGAPMVEHQARRQPPPDIPPVHVNDVAGSNVKVEFRLAPATMEAAATAEQEARGAIHLALSQARDEVLAGKHGQALTAAKERCRNCESELAAVQSELQKAAGEWRQAVIHDQDAADLDSRRRDLSVKASVLGEKHTFFADEVRIAKQKVAAEVKAAVQAAMDRLIAETASRQKAAVEAIARAFSEPYSAYRAATQAGLLVGQLHRGGSDGPLAQYTRID